MLRTDLSILSVMKDEDLSLALTPEWLKGNRYKTVAVEGNIGCGKTTFLQYFESKSRVHILQEPVEEWKNINGFNCFDMMYKDTSRWSSAFQSYVMLTMLQLQEQEEKQGHVKMMERSVHSARHCFVENLHQKGLMSDIDYIILQNWYEWLSKSANTGVNLIVYLKASPETCYNRIKQRNRSEECDIPLDYLKDLHRLHENWLVHKKYGPLPAPVLIIDVDCPQSEVIRKVENLAPAILFEN